MRRHAIVPMVLGLSLWACGEPVGPADGTLAISTSTAGDDPDPDGFQLTIDGIDSLPLLPSGTAEVDLPPGRHTLQLLGVSEHCSVASGTSVAVSIAAGRTTPVAFQVSCPGTGIHVAVTTTGLDPDMDGYLLTIDDIDSLALAPTGAAHGNVAPGRHTLQLLGVAEHCSVTPGPVLELDIARGSTTPVFFQVSCPGTRISVAVTTTGLDPDVDGYLLTIDGIDTLALAPTGTAQVNVAPGRHTLELLGVAEHCSVSPGTVLELDIARGSTTPVAYEVDCPVTAARITVSTTGQSLDLDGYRVIVDGSDRGAIASNGTVLTRLDPGSRTISLAGLASNCALEGPGTRTVTIVIAEVASIEFVVVCTVPPLKGRIAFESSGDIYVMDFDGSNPVNLTQTGSNNFDPAWSPDGTRIAFASARGHPAAIFVMNADGSNPVRLTFLAGASGSRMEPAWSPDGARIAFTYRGRIHVMNADGSNVANLGDVILSNISEYVYHPSFVSLAWSPDGAKIAFSLSNDICCADIWVADADGSNPRNLTRRSGTDDHSPAWSPDGRRIAHTRRHAPGGTADIYVMDAGGGSVANLSNNTASDREPAWSPDGRHIALASDREGNDSDIYVMDADGANVFRLTDRTGSDGSPAWAP